MILNSCCSCLRKVQMRSFPSIVHHLWWGDEKGTTRNCQQKKFDLLFQMGARGKGNILIIQMSTFLTLPKDCFYFFYFFLYRPLSAQSVISLLRTSLSGSSNPRPADYGEFRLATEVRSHPWQNSCFHQRIPQELNWQFSHRGQNLSSPGWPLPPASILSLFASQHAGIATGASLLLPGSICYSLIL